MNNRWPVPAPLPLSHREQPTSTRRASSRQAPSTDSEASTTSPSQVPPRPAINTPGTAPTTPAHTPILDAASAPAAGAPIGPRVSRLDSTQGSNSGGAATWQDRGQGIGGAQPAAHPRLREGRSQAPVEAQGGGWEAVQGGGWDAVDPSADGGLNWEGSASGSASASGSLSDPDDDIDDREHQQRVGAPAPAPGPASLPSVPGGAGSGRTGRAQTQPGPRSGGASHPAPGAASSWRQGTAVRAWWSGVGLGCRGRNGLVTVRLSGGEGWWSWWRLCVCPAVRGGGGG